MNARTWLLAVVVAMVPLGCQLEWQAEHSFTTPNIVDWRDNSGGGSLADGQPDFWVTYPYPATSNHTITIAVQQGSRVRVEPHWCFSGACTRYVDEIVECPASPDPNKFCTRVISFTDNREKRGYHVRLRAWPSAQLYAITAK